MSSLYLLLIALSSPVPAPAVIGTVVDSAGAPLANATVVVAEVARATTTNAEGRFVLRGLPAGQYHLNVTMLGYAPGHLVVRVPPSGDDVTVALAYRQQLIQEPSTEQNERPVEDEEPVEPSSPDCSGMKSVFWRVWNRFLS